MSARADISWARHIPASPTSLYFRPRATGPGNSGSWEGRKDSERVGYDKARDWLERYEPPDIDPVLDEALLEFIKKRESEIPAGLE